MSRYTIRAYLRLYLKNRRKIKLTKQRVELRRSIVGNIFINARGINIYD